MKIIRKIIVIILCAGLLFGYTSCAVFVVKDNGKHKGWYKNSNNPHHPKSTNPGHSKGHSKGKHKKK